ncbi:hypothetical protein J2741_001476 [Methanolinea mesophila]|uniref:hypothetical protein n=1 Tax=Methanolinea mesophila TaxID=547055 RepID=UPI001AE997FE|nr:hypothetical protein [Methanolinea mesophila]MBP1928929.1 hypothetical protein [Methanolinea mesophila]
MLILNALFQDLSGSLFFLQNPENDAVLGVVFFNRMDDPGVPEGALVKMHAVIVGGKDKTGSEVFQYVHDNGYDTGYYAKYHSYG